MPDSGTSMMPARGRPARTRRKARRGLVVVVQAALMGSVAGCVIPGLPRLPSPGPVPDSMTPPSAAMESAAAAHPSRSDPAPTPPDGGRDCFQRHLREAISLNQRRAGRYAQWTEGASLPVSRALIRAERVALIVAWWVDGRARRFQDEGIDIVCAEFVSMALTPMRAPAPVPPATPPPPGPDPAAVERALVAAYGMGGFPAVADAAAVVLARLDGSPDYHCMVRHLVESIERIARLAPGHERAARAAGLASTRPLSELLLRLHLAVLDEGAALDREAAPLQAAGVPILCRDVPPIRAVP